MCDQSGRRRSVCRRRSNSETHFCHDFKMSSLVINTYTPCSLYIARLESLKNIDSSRKQGKGNGKSLFHAFQNNACYRATQGVYV